MFSGSVRHNLDPTATMTDEAIWKALSITHLKRYISLLPEGLEYKMTEGGTNFRYNVKSTTAFFRSFFFALIKLNQNHIVTTYCFHHSFFYCLELSE